MRHEDWQRRFWSAIEEQRRLAFQYGQCDCVLFGASMADAISIDGDYVKRARAAFQWTSAEDADVLLRDGELRTLIESVLGPMQPWVRLRAGDLVLCVSGDDDGQMLCVHDGTSPIGKTDKNLVTLKWASALGGWTVT